MRRARPRQDGPSWGHLTQRKAAAFTLSSAAGPKPGPGQSLDFCLQVHLNPTTIRKTVSNPQDQRQDPAAWKARWPNHCKACGGWGVLPRAGADSRRIANDDSRQITLRLCDALPPGTCHRCGAPDGIDPADKLSRGCRHCGWDFHDRVPVVDGQEEGQ